MDSPDLKRTRRQRDMAVDLSKIDRLPPHSIEAEQGVLGCCLWDGKVCVGQCVERQFSGEWFYDLRHKTLFETLVTMAAEGQAIDLITVRQRLSDAKQLDAIGGVAYLTALVDATPSPANLPFYADIVEEKWTLRRMISTCSQVIGRIYTDEHLGDVEMLLDGLEKEVLSIRRQEVAGALTMRHHVLAVLAKKETDNSGSVMRGLSTGFRTLDNWTRGLKPQNLIIIAARPSVGKTSMALQMAERIALDEKLPVAIFSLEMASEELTELTINRRARLTSVGELNTGEMASLTSVSAAVSAAPMHIFDQGGLTIIQIQATARRLHQQHGIKLIVVDYLQLVKGSGRKENRTVEIGEVSMGLKAMAKELRIPVIALAQLGRDCEKENRPPRMSDLRESGSIEADADIIILLHTTKDEGNFREVELRVEKNRGSRRGKIAMMFNAPLTEFREIDQIEDADRVGYSHDP